MIPWSRVELLDDHHTLESFRCGDGDMDHWFTRAALTEHRKGTCTVRLCLSPADDVCGFFALASHQIRGLDAPKLSGGLETVPATLLGRLGRDVALKDAAIGPILVMEALRAAVGGTDYVGSRLVVLDAKSEGLARWYEGLNFKRFPNSPLRLAMKMSSARVAVKEAFG